MALLLLPNLLGALPSHHAYLPESVDQAVAGLDGLIAESERAGRRYLGRFHTKKPAHLIPIAVVDGKTRETDIDFYLEPIAKGERWGYVSDAGLPCIADPGAKIVARARQRGLSIEAFVGPSSILLALMQSGLPGQNFAFYGYLERDSEALKQRLQFLEKRSREEKSTQIFMEAPHRNIETFSTLVRTLSPSTLLCVALDLTLPTEQILCQPIGRWRGAGVPDLDRPALFLFFTLS